MGYKVFLLQLVISGLIASAQTAPANGTNATETGGRGGRKYDDQQQFISIPVGYYKSPSPPSSEDSEAENDPNPRYNVPKSFEDFVPSDKNYPQYYANRGESYKNPPPPMSNWKGDIAGDDNSPTWTVPSPTDMMMMIDIMKGMNADKTPDDQPTGLLSKLTSDPAAALVAIILPVSILLAAVIPALTSFFSSGQNVPTVTTVATGDGARKLTDNPSFVKPILKAIENFTARSASHPTCLQKSFCEATKGRNGTDFRSIQIGLYKAFTFVDDHWLDSLGMKQLMEAMGTGNCDKIQCSAPSREKKSEDSKMNH